MGNKNEPCHNCPDRYTACYDHCQKPDFLAWQENRKKIHAAKCEYYRTTDYTVDQILKNKKKRR